MYDWHVAQRIIVDRGGVGPTGGVACLSLVALAARGAWGRAAKFFALLLAVLGLGVATKVVHYAWDANYGLGLFRGASGHALRAAALYPTFAWLVFAGSPRRCAIATTLGALLAASVAIASIDPRIHTAAETLAGCVIGMTVPLVVGRWKGLEALRGRWQLLLVACAIVLVAAMPANPLDFEQDVADYSTFLENHHDGTSNKAEWVDGVKYANAERRQKLEARRAEVEANRAAAAAKQAAATTPPPPPQTSN
jgi:hypothetical protein